MRPRGAGALGSPAVPLLVLALAVAVCNNLLAVAALSEPFNGTPGVAPAQNSGFWHYGLVAEDGDSVQLVWSALPLRASPALAASYVIQRWPSPGMPEPGDANYSSSMLDVPSELDSGSRTYSAVDTSSGAALRFYRILALDPSGSVISATNPQRPTLSKGNVLVSSKPCSSSACRSLLQVSTLQAAIDAAAPGSTVAVFPEGSPYMGAGNVDLSFGGKNLTLLAVAGPSATAIDCGASPGCRAFTFAAADGPGVQVSGFTIANGTSTPGGCVSIADSSPTFTNCVFRGCGSRDPASPGNGGAVAVSGAAAAPLFQGCSFQDNYANFGGAIHVSDGSITIQGCEFLRNHGSPGTGQGGALYFLNTQPTTVSDTLIAWGSVGFSGGAISAQLAAEVTLERVKATDNKSGSFAGAILVWGSNMTIIDSELANNTAVVYGGGALVQYGRYNATRTRHVSNTAQRGGGGAISLFSAVALLEGCELSGNSATFGGALNAMRMNDSNIVVPTIVSVNDTLIDGNIATDHGAAFNIESADLAALVNVSITNNVAASKGGGGWCQSDAPVSIYASLVQNNTAAIGGGFFAQGPCPLVVDGSEFKQNSASDYGAGIAVGDGASLDVSQSRFDGNGAAACASGRPISGGGIYVGVEPFESSSAGQCGAGEGPVAYATVQLDTVSFAGNQASDRGGGLHLAAGSLTMNAVEMVGNLATGSSIYDGVGGALALDERCSSGGGCSQVTAQIAGLNATANHAQLAGGALYFGGSNPASRLAVSNSLFVANTADQALQGLGGGLYLGHSNFSLVTSSLTNNSACYGGALLLAADLSQSALLSYLSLSGNVAHGAGPAAFWLRSRSPNATLSCEACNGQGAGQGAAFATEALRMQFAGQPPSLVQSNRDFPSFAVQLLDYYGTVSADTKGVCSVSVNSSTATLGSKGREELAIQGVASFDTLQLKGMINQSYSLEVDFEGSSGPSAKLLPVNPLPALALPVTISSCAPGNQPTTSLDDCVECSDGTYNLDGGACLACPSGAVCTGGSEIRSQANYWRSHNASVDFYACMVAGVCQAGSAAGDAACAPAQQGPLCDVCRPGFFKINGSCKTCNGGQSKAMLAVTVILLTLLAVALFARDWNWGHGPGILTKIKIFVTHFQMLALFSDYDVMWPHATGTTLGWAELSNAGFSMFAPECFFHGGSFYVVYIFQMVLPFVCVGLCVAIYYCAELALRRLDPAGERRRLGPAAGGLVGWLEGLKVRCWKNAFWFVTLLYPRCAMTALQLFGWKKLDVGTFLKADFSIMVKYPEGGFVGTYIKYMVPGCFMLVLYALVIPGFWFAAVYVNRQKLEDPAVQAKYSFLYSSYSPAFPYWETTEMLRKFAIAFCPVFIPAQAGGSLQAAAAQIVLLVYIMLTLRCWPFALGADNRLQLASLVVLWLLLLSAGVAKWAHLSDDGATALSVVQLVLSSGVAFLLGFAILMNGLRLARSWSRKRKAAKAAKQAAKAAAASEMESQGAKPGGGSGEGGSGDIVAYRGPSDSEADIDAESGGMAGSKRGSMLPLSTEEGEIGAAQPGSGGPRKSAASLAVISVHAGTSLGDEQTPGSPYGDGTPTGRRRLGRTSSSMSRRSAADDLEMRLPREGVQRSDSSALLPWPQLPTLAEAVGPPQQPPPTSFSQRRPTPFPGQSAPNLPGEPSFSGQLARKPSELSLRALHEVRADGASEEQGLPGATPQLEMADQQQEGERNVSVGQQPLGGAASQ